MLDTIVRQNEERHTSLDPAKISRWMMFPQILPSQEQELVDLLEVGSGNPVLHSAYTHTRGLSIKCVQAKG